MFRSGFTRSVVLLIALPILVLAGCRAAPSDGLDESHESVETAKVEPSRISNTNVNEEEPPAGNSGVVASEVLSPEAAEKIIRDGLRAYYSDICSDDETTRVAAFDAIMFERKDLAFLFGEKAADELLEVLKDALLRMRSNTAQVKDEISRGGAVVDIELINVREDAKSRYYADVLSAIPETVPVYRAITTYENGAGGGSSSYLVLDGRAVWIQGLDSLYHHLKTTSN